MSEQKTISPIAVCFVCLGNICRSPTAEGIFRHLVREKGVDDRFFIDSAGTGDWHIGHAPDARSQAAALERGVRLEGVARQFQSSDFGRFQYILAMDKSNLENIKKLKPKQSTGPLGKVALFRDFDPEAPASSEVPDPYYGSGDGFQNVFEICERSSRGLLEHIMESSYGQRLG